ncbi:hypothetical protein NDU88_002525 [Pleurodeles waltl]|uniref:Uncharacterized protein n=1 Tax=Pleurodeles waltl TaxID=8319 RepID=A0AAV7SB65_PLEWA|nr:hypothetical protein NDU88_002525 [Pleurodeles waltl]
MSPGLAVATPDSPADNDRLDQAQQAVNGIGDESDTTNNGKSQLEHRLCKESPEVDIGGKEEGPGDKLDIIEPMSDEVFKKLATPIS